eukprot:jgi/Botrbrau1/14310/Bobra.0287s0003.1
MRCPIIEAKICLRARASALATAAAHACVCVCTYTCVRACIQTIAVVPKKSIDLAKSC